MAIALRFRGANNIINVKFIHHPISQSFRARFSNSRKPVSMDILKRGSLRRNLTPVYPFGGPQRIPIPDKYIDWNVEWNYNPPAFTILSILKGDKPWADPEIDKPGFSPRFNEIDGKLNRCSFEGNYQIDTKGYPQNPVGRTGVSGRGSLGKWGPNHAADCIITRWKNDDTGAVVLKENKPVIQFVAVSRRDTGEIAIPGGMVEPGESSTDAAQREFLEEVIGIDNIHEAGPKLQEDLKRVFQNCNIIVKSYVDDHRSTDNAWIETFAVNFHIAEPLNVFDQMKFESGSDAKEAYWVDYDSTLKLYASHNIILKKAVSILHEKWEGKDVAK